VKRRVVVERRRERGHAARTHGIEFARERFGVGTGMAIVDGDRAARRMQAPDDGGTDTAGTAGDEDDRGRIHGKLLFATRTSLPQTVPRVTSRPFNLSCVG